MEYSEQLRNPKWQKKRLVILDRDNWACTICENNEIQLHVHHLKYPEYGIDIWDLDDKYLVTVCNVCHNVLHDLPRTVDTLINSKILTSYDIWYAIVRRLNR